MAAAEALLRERPYRELTVDEVMRRTGLSRPSFYVYFKDRHELVLRVVGHLQAELLEVANQWYESPDGGPEVLERTLARFVTVYGEHSAVLRALADAAADDPAVEAVYRDLIQGFVQATSEHITQEIAAGTVTGIEPVETAKALTWMSERYLYHSFAPDGTVATAAVSRALGTIFTRAIYATS